MSSTAAAAAAYGGKPRRSRRPKRPKRPVRPAATEGTAEADAESGGSARLSVVVRVRPLLEKELERNCARVLRCLGDRVVVLQAAVAEDDVLRKHRSREKRYAFDKVMDAGATQTDVYKNTVRPLLKGVLEGYMATVFAYGPTGAGKTHTMLGTASQPGLMLLTLVDLFRLVGRRAGEYKYSVSMTYVEIYNECLYDLLVEDSDELDLREDGNGQAVVVGATVLPIESAEQVCCMRRVEGAKKTWQGQGQGDSK